MRTAKTMEKGQDVKVKDITGNTFSGKFVQFSKDGKKMQVVRKGNNMGVWYPTENLIEREPKEEVVVKDETQEAAQAQEPEQEAQVPAEQTSELEAEQTLLTTKQAEILAYMQAEDTPIELNELHRAALISKAEVKKELMSLADAALVTIGKDDTVGIFASLTEKGKKTKAEATAPKKAKSNVKQAIRELIERGYDDAQIVETLGCHKPYPKKIRALLEVEKMAAEGKTLEEAQAKYGNIVYITNKEKKLFK